MRNLTEKQIVQHTLGIGIQVKDLKLVFPGYSGQLDAPFNECTDGNPVYRAHALMGIAGACRVPGLKASIRSADHCTVFATPDGVMAITECGRFNALPWRHDYNPLASECGEEFDLQPQIDVPELLNNIYRALFAPHTVPTHWREAVTP